MKEVLYLSKIIDGMVGDDNFIIVEEYPEVKYTLIRRNSNYEPWIVAYNYDKESRTWQQGHYFQTAKEAGAYIKSRYREDE